MSLLRTFLVATWLFWGAFLPIMGGMFLAMMLNFDLAVGALVGGLVALPLSIWGMRLVNRETPPSESTSIGDPQRVWTIIFGVACLALGFAGLARGATWIMIPGNTGGPGLTWTVPGPGGIVVALGMILVGLGLVIHRNDESRQSRWGCGMGIMGLLLFAAGHAIYGVILLIERWAG